MKNTLLLTLLLSLMGAIGVSESDAESSKSILPALLITTAATGLLTWFVIRPLYRYFKSIFYVIDRSVKKLRKQIKEYEKSADKLNEQISETALRLAAGKDLDPKVKSVIEENIVLWREQVEIYKKIIALCQAQAAALQRNKHEIELLEYVKEQVVKEPNPSDKLKKLEALMYQIDQKVKSSIGQEVMRLIYDLRMDTRKERIVQLRSRVSELEKMVG